MALLAFIQDVKENADAVQVLAASSARHRAFPSARSAFEAAQHALLLASDAEYDSAGARAWVYHRRKDQELHRQANGTIPREADSDLTPEEFFSRAKEEMSRIWNDFSPSKGDLIEAADQALAKQARKPDNWTGVNVASELEQRLRRIGVVSTGQPQQEDPARLLRAVYSLLSRESHPRSTRLEPKNVRGEKDGPVTFEFDDFDLDSEAELAMTITAGAVNLAVTAVALRLRLGGGT
jgi:hypothetical protein